MVEKFIMVANFGGSRASVELSSPPMDSYPTVEQIETFINTVTQQERGHFNFAYVNKVFVKGE